MRVSSGWWGIVLAALVGGPVRADTPEMVVTAPWVRAVPPVSSMTAGYLVLENRGSRPGVLLAAESPDFDAVELHRTVEVDGLSRMVAQERVEIPPGARLVLEPGGYHLMLMGFKRPLKPGDAVRLTLRFDGGYALEVSAPVATGADADPGHVHHHQ